VVSRLVNPGSTVDRSLCLTISVGAGMAIECGDLRLVHQLPATRTRNRLHAPALLYNSGQAHPYQIVAANVACLLAVEARQRSGDTPCGRAWASGPSVVAGETVGRPTEPHVLRLGFDAHALAWQRAVR